MLITPRTRWSRVHSLTDRERQICETARELRQRMNLSRSQFARLIGTTKRTVYRWERYEFVPTRVRRFRLEKLKDFLEHIDMRDRIEPVRFVD